MKRINIVLVDDEESYCRTYEHIKNNEDDSYAVTSRTTIMFSNQMKPSSDSYLTLETLTEIGLATGDPPDVSFSVYTQYDQLLRLAVISEIMLIPTYKDGELYPIYSQMYFAELNRVQMNDVVRIPYKEIEREFVY